MVTVQDIVRHKQGDEDVLHTKQRLDAVEEKAGAGTWAWNCAIRELDGSLGWRRLHGLDPHKTLASCEDFGASVHPEDRERAILLLEGTLVNQSSSMAMDYRVVLPDGRIRWISASAGGIFDDFGQPVRITGVCLDVTERKHLDVVAAEAQRDFERFFNLIPDLACIVSTDGYFKKVNPAWEATLGYTREEVLRTPMLEFIHPDDLSAL